MSMDWEILDHEVSFKRFFQLDRYTLRYDKFAGGHHEVVRDIFERGNAVSVIPYDPVRDEIVMVEQFRPGAVRYDKGPWLLELIAGMVDKDETAEQVVVREAKEEANCTVRDLFPVYNYLVSPGGTTEQMTLFAGRTETAGLGGLHGLDSEHEDIKVHVVKRGKAVAMLNAGQISNGLTLIGIQWLLMNYSLLQARWK